MSEQQTEVAGAEPTLEGAGKSKPNGAARAGGPPRVAVIPPSLRRSLGPNLDVEIGPKLEDAERIGPLAIAAEAIDSARLVWEAACLLHPEMMAKASPLVTPAAQELKSREIFYTEKQKSLKRADAALGELRTSMREVEKQIARKAVPPRGQSDLIGELRAQETRAWLRSLPEPERQKAFGQALAGDDAATLVAILERPGLAGIGPERAAMVAEQWRRKAAPEELKRLAVLEQASKRKAAAAAA